MIYTRNLQVFSALFNEDSDAVQTACESANQGNQCAINVCKTEMVFTIKIASSISVGKTDPKLKPQTLEQDTRPFVPVRLCSHLSPTSSCQ